MKRAKLFVSGGSQAVRLPRAFRFEGEREVEISRVGGRVILEAPRRAWSRAFLELAGSGPEFPKPEEPAPADTGPDFE